MSTYIPSWLGWLVLAALVVHAAALQMQLVMLRRDVAWMRVQLTQWGFIHPNANVERPLWTSHSSSSR